MTRHFSSLAILAFAVLMLTSCLGNDNDEVTYYDDTAITAFQLGTVKVRHHTTAHDGVSDSVYTTTFAGTSYAFNIDQVNHTIYNPDSLPVGSDVSRVLASISAKNSGTVVMAYKAQDGSDSLRYFSTADSLDFSKPVKARVYNMMRTAYREYTITVNVHQQNGDDFAWRQQSVDGLEQVGNRKLVAAGGTTYLFGVKDGQTVGYRRNGDSWTALAVSPTLDADAYGNVIAKGSTLVTLSGGNILSSTDGATWTTVGAAGSITQLLGASPERLYALGGGGIMMSTDNGASWTADTLDSDAGNLPAVDLNFVCRASTVNSGTYNLLLIGTRENETMAWSKVEENDANAERQPWAFYNSDSYNRKTLPALNNLRVAGYGNGLVATGGNFSTVYYSPDFGLTWSAEPTYALPMLFGRTDAEFALVRDADNYLYITRAGSATVWHGRLNRLGWDDSSTTFTK